MNQSSKRHSLLLALLTLFSMAHASESFSIRPKISGSLSSLHMKHEKPFLLPSLSVNQGNTIFTETAVQLNAALSTNAARITKDTEDLMSALQYSVGVEFSYNLNQAAWPSNSFIFNPVGSVYMIPEDSTRSTIQGGLYRVLPKMSWGGDLGIKISNNGNHIQLGGGVFSYHSQYETGVIYQSFSRVSNTAIADLDVTAMVKADLFPYTASQETLFPYVYTELSTEIGDIASIFFKINYSFERSPTISNEPDANIQMFPEGKTAFEAHSKWRYSSISIGLSTDLVSLGLF